MQSQTTITQESFTDPDDILQNISEYGIGDIDQNGNVDTVDAFLMLQACVWIQAGASHGEDIENYLYMDVNADGIVDSFDAFYVLQYYAMQSVGSL